MLLLISDPLFPLLPFRFLWRLAYLSQSKRSLAPKSNMRGPFLSLLLSHVTVPPNIDFYAMDQGYRRGLPMWEA